MTFFSVGRLISQVSQEESFGIINKTARLAIVIEMPEGYNQGIFLSMSEGREIKVRPIKMAIVIKSNKRSINKVGKTAGQGIDSNREIVINLTISPPRGSTILTA